MNTAAMEEELEARRVLDEFSTFNFKNLARESQDAWTLSLKGPWSSG